MTSPDVKETLKELPPQLRFAFSPLITRALGISVGMYLGGGLALVTLYHHIFDPEHMAHLGLLGEYFYGYDPGSKWSPLIGLLWGLWTGFVMGWFLAWCRNFVVAVWIFVIRTKASLASNRDFLDHI